MRPDWDTTFMRVAYVMSKMSTCPRAQVGAALVSPERRILSTGFNGAPSGRPHCTDDGCILAPNGSCLRAVHAEVNAITRASSNSLGKGCTLYTVLSPCFSCATLIINVGIDRVVYAQEYHSVDGVPDPVDFLQQSGVLTSYVPIENTYD